MQRILAIGVALLLSASAVSANYVNFESQQVHPIALSADAQQLYVVNTPDNRLAVFDVTPTGLQLAFEVPVGLEPVSVAVRSPHEVWVANHISDTVSIVDLQARQVRATLQVGDEPTDIVFAGPQRDRAFVCVSQEDAVKIYDVNDLAVPPVVVPVFASDPQALAVSPDDRTVYVAVFESGNQTTIASEKDVATHGGPPPPHPAEDAPEVGLILRYDNGHWVDELGTSYNDTHPFTLPDHDVVVLDATAATPAPSYIDGLGTLNFNIAVHPGDGRLFVSNTEARNHERFEPVLRGRFMETRLSIVDPLAPQAPHIVGLNPHIDTSVTPGPPSEIALSLSQPGGMVFDSTGRLYLTALGSAKVALIDDQGVVLDRIEVREGPTGVALDEGRRRLYVLSRFTNSVDIVDTHKRIVVGNVALFDPSPPAVRQGRRFLYDGRLSSGHGDLSCASCHAGANFDGIAWDLGDPNGDLVEPPENEGDLLEGFYPMKGPMVTQTLRGLADTNPLHWRGDRASFRDFNGAFVSLMGRDQPLSVADMQAFEDFVLSIEYGPNPGLQLDGSYPDPPTGPNPARGDLIFRTEQVVSFTCAFCHAQPSGGHHFIINAEAARSTQDVVVPQLRNMYEKTGFDKLPGEKKRGFGYHHDGAIPTLRDFLLDPSFTFANQSQRDDVEAFLLHFDTGMPPAVGAQRTIDASNHSDPQLTDWVQQMMQVADAGGCDLVVKGRIDDEDIGWMYLGNGQWRTDLTGEALLTWNDLTTLASQGAALTATGVPAGSGARIGLDRDADAFPDREELRLGTDPNDPQSRPSWPTDVGPTAGAGAGPLQVSSYPNPAPVRNGTTISFTLNQHQDVQVNVYDVAGRLVARVHEGPMGPGLVQVPWDATNVRRVPVSSGKYYYRISTPHGSTSRSLLIVR